MVNPTLNALLLCLLLPLLLPASAQNCITDTFSGNQVYNSCKSLSQLGGVLHWNYYPSNATVDVAYRAPQSSNGWVAWALNPTGSGMQGAQALIAFQSSGGAMVVYAVPISNYSPNVQDGKLSFKVYSKAAEYSNNTMTIYATVALPSNDTQVKQVWQAGTQFSNGVPSAHSITSTSNTNSFGTIDFLSGVVDSSGGGNSRQHRKNTHGVLNAVSWGILMPLGAIIARYLRVFKSADPAWFYLHAACQSSAYIIGVSGWGLGLKLGSDSVGITYHSHRAIGIILFCLATLQVFALFLRPSKDNKFRFYWNVYHQLIGYSVLILSVVNIFKGFDILQPAEGWKNAYIGIISSLGGLAVILEAVTWTIVLKRRSRDSEVKSHHGANGANGANGYGGREQQVV